MDINSWLLKKYIAPDTFIKTHRWFFLLKNEPNFYFLLTTSLYLMIYMFCIIEFNIIRLLVNYMLIILFFVNHDMLLKIASLTKHLATYLAYIWFITSVMSLFSIYAVSLNIPLSIKQNSYYLTKRKITLYTWEITVHVSNLTVLVRNLTIMKSGKSHYYEKW